MSTLLVSQDPRTSHYSGHFKSDLSTRVHISISPIFLVIRGTFAALNDKPRTNPAHENNMQTNAAISAVLIYLTDPGRFQYFLPRGLC